MSTKKLSRRDQCALIGERALQLGVMDPTLAWASLSRALVDLGDRDVPKFKDLLQAIEWAMIAAKQSQLDRARGQADVIAMNIQDALNLHQFEVVTAKKAMNTGADRQDRR